MPPKVLVTVANYCPVNHSFCTILYLLIGCYLGFNLGPANPLAAQMDQAQQSWEATVWPVIEDSCLDCHAGEAAEGSLDFEKYQTLPQVIADRRLWKKVASRVHDHQMPPADAGELDEQTREQFLNWIDKILPTLPCQHPNHAGPVTIRRLTRYEYGNTVRQLLNVDYPFTTAFPVDEVGYGFDNIGDVLSVSPLLLEKYLNAAEEISELVINDPMNHRLEKTFSPSDFGKVRGGNVRGNFMILTTRATITVPVKTTLATEYQIEVTAFAQQAGDELAELSVALNGRPLKEFSVEPDDREDAETYIVKTRFKKGSNRLQVTFTNDYYDPDHPDRRQRDRNLGVMAIKVVGPTSPARPSAAERAFLFTTPNQNQTARQSASKIIDRHAVRAFRRPLEDDEREKLLQLFDLAINEGESFQGAMQVVLQAILVSPHFLYKVEQPAPTDGSKRSLTDYELATSLAYFLWSSMPDEALQGLAHDSRLTDTGVLAGQVRRMLRDPQATALIENFATQWLQLRLLDQVDPDPDQFPGFSNHLRRSMLKETQMLLADVIQHDAPLTTLLTADYTYVNKTLARHYGMETDGLRERTFVRVPTDSTNRGGLLTHASFLTLTSNPTRTSPVKRGKWILENLLAEPPPPALPDVPQLDSQEELTGSLRERMEQHRADPNCASCHYKMDSLGFALENYDGFGKFRTDDQGLPIDSAGQLPGGAEFTSVVELQKLIAQRYRQAFIRCVVEKLFVYAIGRGPISSDDCIIDGIAQDALQNNLKFSQIVEQIVLSEPFLSRRQTWSIPTEESSADEQNN